MLFTWPPGDLSVIHLLDLFHGTLCGPIAVVRHSNSRQHRPKFRTPSGAEALHSLLLYLKNIDGSIPPYLKIPSRRAKQDPVYFPPCCQK
jgi:hypothetical protein